MLNKRYIISLGGSIIVPEEIDTKFLKQFKSIIESAVKNGHKFVLITGGGRTARRYIEAIKKLGGLNREDLDWLGVHSTRLNGHLLRTIFRKIAHKEIFTNPDLSKTVKEPVVVAAGFRPGSSTDFRAVQFASKYKTSIVLNLSNIDYVYDKNPSTHKDARPIKNISWKDFRHMFGDKWDPGMNTPFDPVASKLAEKLKIKVVVMNGNSFDNLKNFLAGKPFKGTIIG